MESPFAIMHRIPSGLTMQGMKEPCLHARRQIIAQDETLQFVECLDCGEILESDEVADLPAVDESLSDA